MIKHLIENSYWCTRRGGRGLGWREHLLVPIVLRAFCSGILKAGRRLDSTHCIFYFNSKSENLLLSLRVTSLALLRLATVGYHL